MPSKTRKLAIISDIRFVPVRVTDTSQIPGWYRVYAATSIAIRNENRSSNMERLGPNYGLIRVFASHEAIEYSIPASAVDCLSIPSG